MRSADWAPEKHALCPRSHLGVSACAPTRLTVTLFDPRHAIPRRSRCARGSGRDRARTVERAARFAVDDRRAAPSSISGTMPRRRACRPRTIGRGARKAVFQSSSSSPSGAGAPFGWK
jgi:hypothetical protein